jgi:hypothetical protein
LPGADAAGTVYTMQLAAIRRSVDGWQRRRAFAAFAVAVARKFVDDRAAPRS